MKKKLCSLGLALTVLLSGLSLAAVPGVSGAEEITPSGHNVTMIVTLSAPSLLDYVSESDGVYENVGELLLSEEGERDAALIREQQEQLRRQIRAGVPGADFSDSLSYQALSNGFTVKADEAYREWIASLSGVRSAVVSQERKADDPADDSSFQKPEQQNASAGASLSSSEQGEEQEQELRQFGMASKSTVNVQEAYDRGYTGKGTLIAVIDSEFDVRHAAFSVPPEGAKHNRRYVRKVHRTSPFHLNENDEIDDLFYNGKIIYAYDYGDHDTDCYAEDFYHGTHVASIAAGNNGDGNGEFQYLGMAYDAQLALFKISDKSGALKDEAIVAALDDAVKLSPDVINCSYGAVQYLSFDYEGKSLYERLTGSGVAVVASAGNAGYNGFDIGIDQVPSEHVNYYSIAKPSSMTNVFSVASVVPNAYYDNNLYFVLNDERKIQSELYPLDLAIEDIAKGLEGQTLSDGQTQGQEVHFEDDDDYNIEDIYEYVYLDADAGPIDYDQADVKDKILVLHQGEEPLESVVKEAYRHGIQDLIIIRNDAYYRRTYINNAEVSVFMIDSGEKDYFDTHETGMIAIRISTTVYEKVPNDARCVSYYTSFGTKADLTLKPDIAAPGSDVLGAAYEDSYMLLSGTSMSAPCTSGAVAIMKQYCKEQGLTEQLSAYQAQEMIYKLLMSTADLSVCPQELTGTEELVCYSPRQQGAGIINLGKAIRTDACLSVDDCRPKASLRDSLSGEYSFEFSIHNHSDKGRSYYPDCLLQTDGFEVNNSGHYPLSPYLNTLVPESIRDRADVTFSLSGREAKRIFVGAHKSVKVRVSIRLHEDFISERMQYFPNGFYVDGFVRLNATANVSLQMPFSGFCGDWNEEGIFPADIYSRVTEYPDRNSSLAIVSLMNGNNDLSVTAGKNVFGYDDLPMPIAFGRNSIKSYYRISDITYLSYSVLLPNLYLLREAMDYSISLRDQEENLLYYQNYGNISCYYSPYGQPYTEFVDENKHYMVYNFCQCMETLPEGTYEYGIEAWNVGSNGNPGRKENRSYEVMIDNTPPEIQSARMQKTADGRIILTVVAKDNLALQGLSLSAVTFDENKNVESTYDIREAMNEYFGSSDAYLTYSYHEDTGRYVFRYDLTNYQSFLRDLAETKEIVYEDEDMTIRFESDVDYSKISRTVLAIEAVDCAYNCSEMELFDVNAYGTGELTFVDSEGQPMAGVTAVSGGRTFQSGRDGVMKLYNLPLGDRKLKLTDGYRLLNGESAIYYSLSKDHYTFENTFAVKRIEVPQESSEEVSKPSVPERSHEERSSPGGRNRPMGKGESTVILPYHTGESSHPLTAVIPAASAGLGICLLLPAMKRRRRR